METIKNVVGYVYGGAKTHEGQEPVNGAQGAGNVEEPYDKGNEENDDLGGKSAPLAGATTATTTSDTTAGATAPEILEPAQDDSTGATGTKEPWRAHTPRPSEQYPTRPTTSEKAEETAALGPSGAETENVKPDVSTTAEESTAGTSTEAPKSGSVGSSGWFATALPSLPFVGGKSKTTEEPTSTEQASPAVPEKDTPTATATAPSGIAEPTPAAPPAPPAEQTSKEANSLPPNVLPDSVPVGASTDLEPNQGGTGNATAASAAGHTTSDPTTTSSTAAPHNSRFVESDPDASPSTSNLPGKNPDAIPTAGGKRIGSIAAIDSPPSSSPAGTSTAPATTSDPAITAPPMDSTQVSPKTSFTGTSSSTAIGSESKAPETSSPLAKSAVPIAGSHEKETAEDELHGKDKLKAKLHKLKEKIKH